MAIPLKHDPNHRKYKRAHRRHRNLVQKDNKHRSYVHRPITAYDRKKVVDFEVD